MNNALVTFKTDKKTKEAVKSFADELGLNSSSFINMVVKQALREKRIVVGTNLEPTPYLENVMRKAEEDYKNDRDITHTTSPSEALAHLDSLMKK